MDTKIIFYKQNKLTQNAKFKLRKDLLGIEQMSNFSRYSYHIEGILDKIPNYKPIKSSIIIEKKNLKLIKNILTKYNATFEVFDIKIPKSKLTK